MYELYRDKVGKGSRGYEAHLAARSVAVVLLCHHVRQTMIAPCRTCCMLDRPDVLGWLAAPTCQTQTCCSDEETAEAACLLLRKGSADMIWLQLWGLAHLYEDRWGHSGQYVVL